MPFFMSVERASSRFYSLSSMVWGGKCFRLIVISLIIHQVHGRISQHSIESSLLVHAYHTSRRSEAVLV
jgi:hypothetical protein